MKQPKEPKTFKYPRLYMRLENCFDSMLAVQRIRIIYPNGDCEWGDGDCAEGRMIERLTTWADYRPCWHPNKMLNVGDKMPSLCTAKEAVKLMKQFDKNEGFDTIFLGEIK